jgi:hypothetical protein
MPIALRGDFDAPNLQAETRNAKNAGQAPAGAGSHL